MGVKLVHADLNSSRVEEQKRSLRSLLAANWKGVEEAASLARDSPERIEALRRLLEDPQDNIRRDAGWALHYFMGKCSGPLPRQLIESLGQRLGDTDPNVRSAAANALGGYVRSLQMAGVDRKAIKEIMEPAMPYIVANDYHRTEAEKMFGIYR